MKKKRNVGKFFMFLALASLTVVGAVVIWPLIDKYAKKAYKASLKKEEIDFDDMGPQIIPNDKED